MEGAERRAFPRAAWPFIVRCKDRESGRRTGWEVLFIKDISIGGCSFLSAVSHNVGDILDLTIKIPAVRDPVRLVGEVRHTRRHEEEGVKHYYVGVKFLKIEKPKARYFIDAIEYALKRKERVA